MRKLAVAVACAVLFGCAALPRPAPPAGDVDRAPEPHEIPADIAMIPDAVPQDEPKSASGNAPEYEVFGEKYEVLASARDFRERGRASFYAKKFHGRKTASGERYDMFAMTAAHKSLPLPTYVRVTNTDNGRSVIVKVNDRGPFIAGRVIDLSYAAAAKLGMIDRGHVPVEVEAVIPDARPVREPGWLQVATYTDPINAFTAREELGQVLGPKLIDIWSGGSESEPLHRLVVGPFDSPAAAQLVHHDLKARGYIANWVTN